MRLFLLLPLLLAGCAHFDAGLLPAPHELPPRWSVALPEGVAENPQPADRQWWKTYHDPVLDTLVEQAVAHNTDLRLAAERVLQADALRRSAKAGLFPDSYAEMSATASSGGTSAGGRDSAFGGVGASWEIDVSGRLSAALRAANASWRATTADADTVRHLVIASTVETYIEYRLQQQVRVLAEDSVGSQERTLELTRHRYEAGVTGNLEVQRAQVLVSQTRAELALARSNAEAARFRLATLLAATPEQTAEWLGEEKPIPTADPLVLLQTPAEVLAKRPDIRAAAERFQAAAAQRQIAAALRWPTFSLSALLGFDGNSVRDVLDGTASLRSVSAGLTAPLFDFGRLRAEYDSADSELRQADLAYEQAVRAALEDTQTALVSYIEGEQQAKELTDASQAAQKTTQIAKWQYDEGILSQFEVLDAERTVYQARRQEAQAQADAATALAQVYWHLAVAD